jgi:outer membrane protein TolC
VNKKALLLAISLVLAASPVFGEVVSLREAINRALNNNHLLKAAALDEQSARTGVAISKSRYLPRVALESGAQLSNTPSSVFMMKLDEGRINPASDFAAGALNNPDPRADFRTALRLEQPLLDFGIATGVDLAAKDAEAAKAGLEQAREQTAFRVYLAYLEVRRARAFRDIAEQALADAKEHSRLAQLRERDGVGLKSDQLRAVTEVAEAEQQLVSARNDELLARLRLNLVVGGPQGETLDIGEAPVLAEPQVGQPELVALAQRSRADLAGAEKALEKGALAVRQANNAFLPTLYASAGYQVNDRNLPLGYDKDSWNVGVNLRWDLFDGSRRSLEKGRAELARQAAAELLENGRREVALQVAEGMLRRQEATARLSSARAALQAAGESLRLVTVRFANGLSPMVELMDAEAALNRARANLVEVENADRRSVAQLYQAAGVFLKEVMR